jgi:hypothetical protein
VNNVINLMQTQGGNVRSNIFFGAGQTVGGKWTGDIQCGSGSYTIANNCPYNRYATNAVAYSCNLNDSPAGAVTFTNNYIVSQVPMTLNGGWNSLNFTNNVLVMNCTNANFQAIIAPVSSAGWGVDWNNYFAQSPEIVKFRYLVTNFWTLAQWQSGTSLDLNTVGHDNSLPTNQVFVIPNQDQVKRAHLAIYNWMHQDNVTVDCSSFLTVGDSYRVYTAQGYNNGAVLTGVYSAPILLPMTNLPISTILSGTNWGLQNPASMSPEFGAFVVIGAAGNTTWNVTVNSTPNGGGIVTVSPGDNNGFVSVATSGLFNYNNGVSVTLTAPAQIANSNFQKWQTNGVDATTSSNITFTVSAAMTNTAVYKSFGTAISGANGGGVSL